MTTYSVVTPNNLNQQKGFEFSSSEKKINVKVDGTSVGFNSTGAIEVKGKFLSNPTLDHSDGLRKLKFDVVGSEDKLEIDLTEFLTDIHVESASYNPETTTLTLQETASAPAITVDLGKLAETTTGDTDTIGFTGKGTKLDPLKANIKPEGLVKTAGGLKVEDGKLVADKDVLFDVTLTDAFSDRVLGFISSTGYTDGD